MTTYDKSRDGLKITEVGTPDARLLRQWAAAPDNLMCWGLDRVADELERLSTALSNDIRKWTPIGERLPDEDVRVLGVDTNGRVNIVANDVSGGVGWHDDEWMPREVTHWMPLPESPK